jgi:hypothetical protein
MDVRREANIALGEENFIKQKKRNGHGIVGLPTGHNALRHPTFTTGRRRLHHTPQPATTTHSPPPTTTPPPAAASTTTTRHI